MLTVNPSLCSFLSTAGGVGKEATIYYNYLADLLQYFNYILSWMLSALSFSLLCSAVLVICGKRKLQSSELPVSPLSEKLYSYWFVILLLFAIKILFLLLINSTRQNWVLCDCWDTHLSAVFFIHMSTGGTFGVIFYFLIAWLGGYFFRFSESISIHKKKLIGLVRLVLHMINHAVRGAVWSDYHQVFIQSISSHNISLAGVVYMRVYVSNIP